VLNLLISNVISYIARTIDCSAAISLGIIESIPQTIFSSGYNKTWNKATVTDSRLILDPTKGGFVACLVN
jgi:hypothetical protein